VQKQFEILKITRNNLLDAIESLSIEELNTIPKGFKNNIVWNVAHIIVTQQLLCYKLSGLEMLLDDSFVDFFKKGTAISHEVEQEEVELIKAELKSLANKLAEDYNSGLFKQYKTYPTSYNVTLNSIEDAIQFNNIHEALHFGYIMAMKKAV